MQSFVESNLAHSFAYYFGVEYVGSVKGRERIHSSQTTVEKHGYSGQCHGTVGTTEREDPPTGNVELWLFHPVTEINMQDCSLAKPTG